LLTAVKRWLLRFQVVKSAKAARDAWHRPPIGKVILRYSPGHFYSPIPDLRDIQERDEELFSTHPDALPGIDLRAQEQLALVRDLARFYDEQPFRRKKSKKRRYYFDNPYFSYGDALMLYGMLRHLRPNRLIEVGSGFSSAATLDTNERFLDGELHCTFIEPYPQRLNRLLRGDDHERHQVIEQPVQSVDLSVFDRLGKGDVLFIDSTHVSRIGSDVHRLYFDVVPRLRPGVVVHIHDVFYPFQYPREWVYSGRFWTEAYLLRALLMDNPNLRIMLWNSYLAEKHPQTVGSLLPLWRRNMGGSLWLERR
jgi:hypothetical protein